jgi:hypothetical protein
VDVGALERGRRQRPVAVVPTDRGKLGERGRDEVDRVAGELRVGDVTLHAAHPEGARERAAPAVLDRVAEAVRGGGLADDAVVDALAARGQPLDDLHGAVGRDTFLVGGEQQRDRPVVPRVCRHERLGGGHERRNRAFHVGRPAPVEPAVAHLGAERVAVPGVERAGGHDVGVAGEAHQRPGLAAPQPQVGDAVARQRLGAKAERGEALRDQRLAAVVVGGDGAPRDELAGERERGLRAVLHGRRW